MLRVGVLCDGDQLAAWQVQCLEQVLGSGVAEIPVLVVNTAPGSPPKPLTERLGQLRRNGLFLWRLYDRLVLSRRAKSLRPQGLPGSLRDKPRIRCVPVSVGKYRQSFDDATIAKLEDLKLDVLLRFGFGILTGAVLDVARYGIWSFHHGDPHRYRGAPPGFWEIHDGHPVTGVILQRLTEDLDGGVVLERGEFKTFAASYPRSLDSIFFGPTHFVARALKRLARDSEWWSRLEPLDGGGPIYRYPRTRAMVRFVFQSVRARLSNQCRALLKHQQWTIGVVKKPLEELVRGSHLGAHPDVHWFPERKGRFFADPMIVNGPHECHLLVEEFDWRTGRGHITSFPLASEQLTLGCADLTLQRPFHLSYPYAVPDTDDALVVPEAAESGRLKAIRLDNTAADVDLLEFPAVDPTIFKHEGRWWLFCTSAEAGANHALFAWHSDHQLGPWTPHSANPIKLDVRNSRPAGPPILIDGNLIRPAQDCSTDYGAAVVFNRVLCLTPDEFEEEAIGRLEPDPQGLYPVGLHTVAGWGDKTIVDGARWSFVPAEMQRALLRKLRRLRVNR